MKVEAADWEHAHAHARQQIADGGTALRVGERRDHPDGLVQQDVDRWIGNPQQPTVNCDPVSSGVRLRPQGRHRQTVHLHAPRADHLLRLAP